MNFRRVSRRFFNPTCEWIDVGEKTAGGDSRTGQSRDRRGDDLAAGHAPGKN